MYTGNFYLTNPQKSAQKNVVNYTPRNGFGVLAFAGLGYRLGPQTLLALTKEPFLV
jgi:hypothetical protein